MKEAWAARTFIATSWARSSAAALLRVKASAQIRTFGSKITSWLSSFWDMAPLNPIVNVGIKLCPDALKDNPDNGSLSQLNEIVLKRALFQRFP
jgi:hypothetical protein